MSPETRQGPQARTDRGDGTHTRAVGYVRVSSKKQQERGFSLETQREKIETYAEDNDLELVNVHTDVISTKDPNPDRSGFYQVLNAVTSDQADKVLIRGTKRLGRNMPDRISLGSKARTHSVELVALDGEMSYDMENPQDELIYNIKASVDRFENRMRTQLVRKACEKRAEMGYWPQGQSPTGYRTIDAGKGKVLEPTELAWYVPQVFRYYIEVKSQQKVREWALDLPYDVPCGQSTIGRILKNKVYLGMVPLYDEWREGRHEPLVSEELWMEAKRVRRRGPGRPPKD